MNNKWICLKNVNIKYCKTMKELYYIIYIYILLYFGLCIIFVLHILYHILYIHYLVPSSSPTTLSPRLWTYLLLASTRCLIWYDSRLILASFTVSRQHACVSHSVLGGESRIKDYEYIVNKWQKANYGPLKKYEKNNINKYIHVNKYMINTW